MGKGGQKSQEQGRKISLEELAAHRTPTDAWLSYQGKVYDVSNWETHPGGSVIFTHAGDDCTDIFAAFHPVSAHKSLQKFEIGSLDESVIPQGLYANKRVPQEQKEFEQAYRTLRSKLVAMGMFNSSPAYYVYKFTSTVMLLVVSVLCATQSEAFGKPHIHIYTHTCTHIPIPILIQCPLNPLNPYIEPTLNTYNAY